MDGARKDSGTGKDAPAKRKGEKRAVGTIKPTTYTILVVKFHRQ